MSAAPNDTSERMSTMNEQLKAPFASGAKGMSVPKSDPALNIAA